MSRLEPIVEPDPDEPGMPRAELLRRSAAVYRSEVEGLAPDDDRRDFLLGRAAAFDAAADEAAVVPLRVDVPGGPLVDPTPARRGAQVPLRRRTPWRLPLLRRRRR